MTSYPKQLAAALNPAVSRALDFLEAFINARNGRCMPMPIDLDEAERALAAARGIEFPAIGAQRGAGTPSEFGRAGY